MCCDWLCGLFNTPKASDQYYPLPNENSPPRIGDKESESRANRVAQGFFKSPPGVNSLGASRNNRGGSGRHVGFSAPSYSYRSPNPSNSHDVRLEMSPSPTNTAKSSDSGALPADGNFGEVISSPE